MYEQAPCISSCTTRRRAPLRCRWWLGSASRRSGLLAPPRRRPASPSPAAPLQSCGTAPARGGYGEPGRHRSARREGVSVCACLDVESRLGRGFDEEHARLAPARVPLLGGHLPPLHKVRLVAHQHNHHVRAALGAHLLHPPRRVHKRRAVCGRGRSAAASAAARVARKRTRHVVHHHGDGRVADVGRNERAEALLPRGVPAPRRGPRGGQPSTIGANRVCSAALHRKRPEGAAPRRERHTKRRRRATRPRPRCRDAGSRAAALPKPNRNRASGARLRLRRAPQLQPHGAVLQIHRLGQEVDANRRLRAAASAAAGEHRRVSAARRPAQRARLVGVVELVIHEARDDGRLAHRLVAQEDQLILCQRRYARRHAGHNGQPTPSAGRPHAASEEGGGECPRRTTVRRPTLRARQGRAGAWWGAPKKRSRSVGRACCTARGVTAHPSAPAPSCARCGAAARLRHHEQVQLQLQPVAPDRGLHRLDGHGESGAHRARAGATWAACCVVARRFSREACRAQNAELFTLTYGALVRQVRPFVARARKRRAGAPRRPALAVGEKPSRQR